VRRRGVIGTAVFVGAGLEAHGAGAFGALREAVQGGVWDADALLGVELRLF
jgi:hypothetical protein